MITYDEFLEWYKAEKSEDRLQHLHLDDAAVQAALATVSDFNNMQNYSHSLDAIMALRETVAAEIEASMNGGGQ